MSGPYCGTCKHFKPNPFDKDTGECYDPAKIIYSFTGNRIASEPEVNTKCECENHEQRENCND